MPDAAFDLPQPGPGDAGPYTLVGQARAKAGHGPALEAALLALVAPTRLEAGALEYHVHRDRTDPELFVFYEAWASIGHLKAHLAQPYIQAFLASRMEHLAEDMEVRWLAMASPYPGRNG